MNTLRSIFRWCWCWLVLAGIFVPIQVVKAGWKDAEPGWRYEWPRDHASHPGFRTEWWYFTGQLLDQAGQRYGYELTFFRIGLRPPDATPATSRFVVSDLKIAHFALTEVTGKRFSYWQNFTRGAFAEAGFGDGVKEPRLAWNGEWTLTLATDGKFQLLARQEGTELRLTLESRKPFVTHGRDGVSRKSETPGFASHYYSATRLHTTGTLTVEGKAHDVRGESWFDHEWSSNQLAPNLRGWDWFSLQFEDGSELMLYQLRRHDGSADPASSGTWIAADGTTRHLTREEFRLTPTQSWLSPKTGGRYPIGWQVEVPSLQLTLQVTPTMSDQELALLPVCYWEGLIDVRGQRQGQPVIGHGYLELTGYAGEVVGLSAEPAK